MWRDHVKLDLTNTGYVRRNENPGKSSVGITDMIPVGVGLQQGFSLSPYLFAMIMDVLARGIKDLFPWCMLYADDEWRRVM